MRESGASQKLPSTFGRESDAVDRRAEPPVETLEFVELKHPLFILALTTQVRFKSRPDDGVSDAPGVPECRDKHRKITAGGANLTLPPDDLLLEEAGVLPAPMLHFERDIESVSAISTACGNH